MLDAQTIRENLRSIKEEISGAAKTAGRNPEDITLVAVSKRHPPEAISSIVQAGHFDIGENYVQEAEEKQSALNDPAIRWHFIGQIQSRKAKYVAGNFHLIHAVDRIKLANALHSQATEMDLTQPVLVQVNISGEETKAGIAPEDINKLVEHIFTNCNQLDLQGLMCMPPVFDQGEAARPYFAKLRKLKEEIEQRLGTYLPHLSMGMSGDYFQAIQEGSTLVRIGTNIFGQR